MQKRESELAKRIAEEVRRLRKDRGWSQGTLAEHTDLSLNYVSLIECADRLPSLEVLLRLGTTLGVEVRDLLGEAPALEQGERATLAEPWLDEAVALLRTLPAEARPVAIGVLRGVAEATAPKGSGVRRKRTKKRG